MLPLRVGKLFLRRMLAFALAVHATSPDIPMSSLMDLKLCVTAPNPSVSAILALAVEHINTRNFSFVDDVSHMLNASITVTTAEENDVQGTFSSVTSCILGAHTIVGLDSINALALSQTILPFSSTVAISYAATSSELSAAPFFARTVPSDIGLSSGFITFVLAAGWRRVVFLYSDDTYGKSLYASCQSAAIRRGVELVPARYEAHHSAHNRLQSATNSVNTTLRSIRQANARVIMFAGVSSSLEQVLQQALGLGMIGPGSDWQWLGFENWVPCEACTAATARAMHGSVRLVLRPLQGISAPTLAHSAESFADSSSSSISTSSFTSSSTPSSVSAELAFAYDAIWLSALAFSSLAPAHAHTLLPTNSCAVLASASPASQPFRAARNPLAAKAYLAAVRGISFRGASGTVALDANTGDRVPQSMGVKVESVLYSDHHGVTIAAVGRAIGADTGAGAFELPPTLIWFDGSTTVPRDQLDGGEFYTPWVIAMLSLVPTVLMATAVAICCCRCRKNVKAKRTARRQEDEDGAKHLELVEMSETERKGVTV